MRGLLAALALGALALPLPLAAADAARTGGETDGSALALAGGYYATRVGASLEVWKEQNGVEGLQRTHEVCGIAYTPADTPVYRVQCVGVGAVCVL